eukprot:2967343-Prymnesium_polylepis.1
MATPLGGRHLHREGARSAHRRDPRDRRVVRRHAHQAVGGGRARKAERARARRAQTEGEGARRGGQRPRPAPRPRR